MKSLACVGFLLVLCNSFTPNGSPKQKSIELNLFENWKAFGSASKDDLDEQWEAQQEILTNRRKPEAERKKYFDDVAERRKQASEKQNSDWNWQTRAYKKGEDPINEWKKKREEGTISDLNNQYGDPKKIGGIPLPSASFGVGGEFGVGGKFDNGGRFDLRLPYAEQGYVDDESDVMGQLKSFFGGPKPKQGEPKEEPEAEEPKNKLWPF